MKKTKYEEQLEKLNDKEALFVLACLANPKTRELTRIFHCITSHAQEKLIKASQNRLNSLQKKGLEIEKSFKLISSQRRERTKRSG